MPFPEGTTEAAPTTVVWGIAPPGAATGIRGTACGERDPRRVRSRLVPAPTTGSVSGSVCVTGDSANECLAAARAVVVQGGGAHVVIGGAGNKILAVAEGRADVAIMHFGTSLWDT